MIQHTDLLASDLWSFNKPVRDPQLHARGKQRCWHFCCCCCQLSSQVAQGGPPSNSVRSGTCVQEARSGFTVGSLSGGIYFSKDGSQGVELKKSFFCKASLGKSSNQIREQCSLFSHHLHVSSYRCHSRAFLLQDRKVCFTCLV